MATVTVLTAARMLAIEALSVVSGVISGDNLILTRHDGTTINAGNVRGPKGDPGPAGGMTSTPAGGALTGNFPNPSLADGAVSTAKLSDDAVTHTKVAAANRDGTATTPGMRTLGNGAQQAAPGNHTHPGLSDTGWVNFTATAGDSPFAGTAVARAQYRKIGQDVHVRVQKNATAALNYSSSTSGNFGNVDVLGGLPASVCPTTASVNGVARFDDTPVTVTLSATGVITIGGGFPRAWASGDVFQADFRFFTDAV